MVATRKKVVERNGAEVPEKDTPVKGKAVAVQITPPKIEVVKLKIVGTAPLVMNRFSQKAMSMIHETQAAGSQSAKGKKRAPKNFEEAYQGARHISTEGWDGIPSPAFRLASISACRLVGFKMTLAKLAIFVDADGFDQVDGTPLTKITKGQPHYVEHAVRNDNGSVDLRARPMWDVGWEAIVTVRYDSEIFSISDVVNLFARIGQQVGIGEGRPDSKNSAGQGWGLFEFAGVL